MALKTKDLIISDEGRDKGKIYLITEMPALKAEKWAARLFLAMARSGADIPIHLLGSNIVAAAVMGIGALSSMNFAEAELLLDEMLTCVTFKPDINRLDYSRPLAPGEIEEVATILQLRMEVITLHTGFTLADVRSALSQMQASADQTTSEPRTSPG